MSRKDQIPFIAFWNEHEMWGGTRAMNMKDGQGHPILSCGGISVLEKKKK